MYSNIYLPFILIIDLGIDFVISFILDPTPAVNITALYLCYKSYDFFSLIFHFKIMIISTFYISFLKKQFFFLLYLINS